MKNIIKGIREWINLLLYDSKEAVMRFFRYSVLFTSIAAVGILIYYFGFPQSGENKQIIFNIIKISFGIYVLNFMARWIYSFEPLTYIRKNWFEAMLMLMLMTEGISAFFFQQPLLEFLFKEVGINNFTPIILIITQVYLWIIVALELGKASSRIISLQIGPSSLLILSFLILIITGTGLLLLPEMTTIDGSMPFFEALFTSTSACCVTGLIVVDTATYFTFKGHFVLILLMQAGGLNIITFATFFASLSGGGNMSFKQQSLLREFTSSENILSSKGLLRQIIVSSLLIELIGVVSMYFSWNPEMNFSNQGDKIFYSIFHAVSAFNNAGFSLFTDGFYDVHVRHSYLLHVVTAVLIILGGLGFTTLKDVFNLKNLIKRVKQPWRKPKISSRIALYSSFILIILGTIGYFFLEQNNSIENYDAGGALVTSFFQSVTTRTAGFNTVDFSTLSVPVLVFMLAFMFIGASSGSTGGGIKTSTFTLLLVNVYSTLRGKKKIELFHRTISNKLLYQAFSVLLFSISIIFTGTFLLTLTDGDKSLISLIFEEISAFATVGLSTGITAELSTMGKVIIMLSMFVGRVGILTLAFALSKRAISTKYKYPEANLLVG